MAEPIPSEEQVVAKNDINTDAGLRAIVLSLLRDLESDRRENAAAAATTTTRADLDKKYKKLEDKVDKLSTQVRDHGDYIHILLTEVAPLHKIYCREVAGSVGEAFFSWLGRSPPEITVTIDNKTVNVRDWAAFWSTVSEQNASDFGGRDCTVAVLKLVQSGRVMGNRVAHEAYQCNKEGVKEAIKAQNSHNWTNLLSVYENKIHGKVALP